ncbi:MAG TPA: hypothetical protein VG253_11160 [Streptosporangiaceae bacterium]|nr:hypothetical protein [Streptosporangiaceae bacterium]
MDRWLTDGTTTRRAVRYFLHWAHGHGLVSDLNVPLPPRQEPECLRNTARLALAAELPASVLADLKGISVGTAERWSQWAKRDWAAYAGQRTADERRGIGSLLSWLGGSLRSFTDLDALIGMVPSQVVTRLSAIDFGRGSEALYRDQMPGLLTELADRARVLSITASWQMSAGK